jgi:hypothetical protein
LLVFERMTLEFYQLFRQTHENYYLQLALKPNSTSVTNEINTRIANEFIARNNRSFGYSETVLFENSLLTASTVPYTFQYITLSEAYTNFTHLVFDSFSTKGILDINHISSTAFRLEDTIVDIKSSTTTRSLLVKSYFLIKISGINII